MIAALLCVRSARGECYDSTSITEDYEITLALKTLGYRCLCPPGCTAVTELMPTWPHLFRQRLRWQSGTLTALRRYGFTQATWTNWVRQAFFYGRYCSQLACWAVLVCSLITRFGFNMPGWVLGMLLTIYLERVITARGAGAKGVLVAALLFPEWWYGMFDGLYLFQALKLQFTRRDVRTSCFTTAAGANVLDPVRRNRLRPRRGTLGADLPASRWPGAAGRGQARRVPARLPRRRYARSVTRSCSASPPNPTARGTGGDGPTRPHRPGWRPGGTWSRSSARPARRT
jgi:hypothetical protein